MKILLIILIGYIINLLINRWLYLKFLYEESSHVTPIYLSIFGTIVILIEISIHINFSNSCIINYIHKPYYDRDKIINKNIFYKLFIYKHLNDENIIKLCKNYYKYNKKERKFIKDLLISKEPANLEIAYNMLLLVRYKEE